MQNSENSGEKPSILFYFFIGQVVLGLLVVLAYLIYSYITG